MNWKEMNAIPNLGKANPFRGKMRMNLPRGLTDEFFMRDSAGFWAAVEIISNRRTFQKG